METKSLAAFKAAYECGSISKAANRLFMSHQGLSKTLEGLEVDLGVTLFERTNRGITPTEAGRALYPKAVRVIDLVNSMYADVTSSSAAETIVVACTSGGLTYDTSRFAADFTAAHPSMRLRFEEGNDARVASLVEQGLAACGFVAGPVKHATFEAIVVARHPHALVVPANDPLATQPFARLSDVEGRRLVLIGDGFAPFDYLQDRLAREGIRPVEVIGVPEISTGSMLAAAGKAVAITADFTVMPHPLAGVAVLPFDDATLTWDISFITRRAASVSQDVQEIGYFAQTWYRRIEQEFTWRKRWDVARQAGCN